MWVVFHRKTLLHAAEILEEAGEAAAYGIDFGVTQHQSGGDAGQKE